MWSKYIDVATPDLSHSMSPARGLRGAEGGAPGVDVCFWLKDLIIF